MTEFNIEIDLGENKKIQARKWMGKERRLLQKIMNSEVDYKLEDVLVYGCIKNKDSIYLTQRELSYILFVIYISSFESNLTQEYSCSSCGCNNIVDINLNDTLKNSRLSKFSPITINEYTYNLQSTMSNTPVFIELQKNTETDEDKLFNELCVHSYEITKNSEEVLFSSFTELSTFIDELPIKEFDELINTYISQAFSFIPAIDYICSNSECNQDNVEFVDIVKHLVDRFYE